MEGRLAEFGQLLNQALQEKKLLQSEVSKLSLKNMELFEEKEKKKQISPNEIQEFQMKVKIFFHYRDLLLLI